MIVAKGSHLVQVAPGSHRHSLIRPGPEERTLGRGRGADRADIGDDLTGGPVEAQRGGVENRMIRAPASPKRSTQARFLAFMIATASALQAAQSGTVMKAAPTVPVQHHGGAANPVEA